MSFKFTVAVLLSATALVACGNNSNNNTGGETEETVRNPIASGKYKTEVSEVSGFTAMGDKFVLELDPSGKKYTTTYTVAKGGEFKLTGDFDPETGELGEATCSGDCDGVDTDGTKIDTTKWVGDGAVLLSTEDGSIFGSTPAKASDLPTAKTTYTGKAFVSYSKDLPGTELDIDDKSDVGNAETTVNFDAGKLSTKFDGFTGDLKGLEAKVRDASIKGTTFTGGEFWIKDASGEFTSIKKGADVYGQFFGLNGEEVAGQVSAEKDNPKKNVTFDAGWNGTK